MNNRRRIAILIGYYINNIITLKIDVISSPGIIHIRNICICAPWVNNQATKTSSGIVILAVQKHFVVYFDPLQRLLSFPQSLHSWTFQTSTFPIPSAVVFRLILNSRKINILHDSALSSTINRILLASLSILVHRHFSWCVLCRRNIFLKLCIYFRQWTSMWTSHSKLIKWMTSYDLNLSLSLHLIYRFIYLYVYHFYIHVLYRRPCTYGYVQANIVFFKSPSFGHIQHIMWIY